MNRRSFLRKTAGAAAVLALPGCGAGRGKPVALTDQPRQPTPGSTFVDVHCHVGQRARPCQEQDRFSFEPPGVYAPFDAYMSDRIYNGLGGVVSRWYFGGARRLHGSAERRPHRSEN